MGWWYFLILINILSNTGVFHLTPRLPLVHFWVNGWFFANLDSKTWSKGSFTPSYPHLKFYCGSRRATYKYSGDREKYTGRFGKLDVWKTVCENEINRGKENING